MMPCERRLGEQCVAEVRLGWNVIYNSPTVSEFVFAPQSLMRRRVACCQKAKTSCPLSCRKPKNIQLVHTLVLYLWKVLGWQDKVSNLRSRESGYGKCVMPVGRIT